MQEIIVWLIVAIAMVYIIIKFYRNFTGKNKGCCGECNSCGTNKAGCDSKPAEK